MSSTRMYYHASVMSSFPKSGRKPLFGNTETPGPGRYSASNKGSRSSIK